ncbi:unnamed protein product [Anisakis simplex]|uniref:adenylate cyclase n=1 Tax=Anisakis simplex TaxID=6269 RepID=A0A3P6QHS2_ANISI|nr:unnamed protein product [Anisakis simplex]
MFHENDSTHHEILFHSAIYGLANAKNHRSLQTELVSSVVPPHLVHGIRQYFTKTSPTLYTEQYAQVTCATLKASISMEFFSVFYGRLIGLEEICSQCSPQDSARLLNEFNSRIDQIAKKSNCIRLQSDGILIVAGIPNISDDHLRNVVLFAIDLQTLIRSFCDSTSIELGLCCGIESGSVSAGIVGTTKWHYDIIGSPLDEAINIERTRVTMVHIFSGIFLGDNAKQQSQCYEFNIEKRDRYWCVVPQLKTNLSSSTLFPNLRRFSLVTVPQAVNRLLQTIASASDSLLKTNALPGRRKKKMEKLLSVGDKLANKRDQGKSLMQSLTLKFRNEQMETAVRFFFHMQLDEWFIPALAISIFFLVVYGVYHVLVLPRQIATLALIVVALTVMFIVLLMLYINYFEFSCPQSGELDESSECYVVHFSLLSCAIWMLSSVVFIRLPSIVQLYALLIAFILYSLHVFVTHPMLYYSYSQLNQFVIYLLKSSYLTYRVEWELMLGLLTLIGIIFIQSRSNERILRLDFMSKLKQMLLNALPSHVAQTFYSKSELHHHLCHSVGVAFINVINASLCQERKDVYDCFQILLQHHGIEKIKSCSKMYIAAVGILPETSKNVLSFYSFLFHYFNSHFIIPLCIDCGSVLSAVISNERPTYELIGDPCLKARQLMQHAACYGIMVSEEIYLALRPRNFNFDSRPIVVSPQLTAYVFEESHPTAGSIDETRSQTEPPIHQDSENPLQMFTSMDSSFSSEVYSIDVGVETDSDMEWITPEMLMYEKKKSPSKSSVYNSSCCPQSSNASECDKNSMNHEKVHSGWMMNGRKSSSWMSIGGGSIRSDLTSASYANDIERLTAASNRVDRMLQELTSVTHVDIDNKLECHPFPTALSASNRSLRFNRLKYSFRREISSACHTEYDNAESEGICSDSEMLEGRLERIKHALKAGDSRRKRRRNMMSNDNGNDADIDSVCSSLNASSIFDNFRWNR